MARKHVERLPNSILQTLQGNFMAFDPLSADTKYLMLMERLEDLELARERLNDEEVEVSLDEL